MSIGHNQGMPTPALATSQNNPNKTGIIATVCGMTAFIVNDSLVKASSEHLAGAQLIFIRGLFAITLLSLLVHWYFGLNWRTKLPNGQGAWWQTMTHRKVLARSVVDAAATLCYLLSLFHLQIGIATAINMATPLLIAAGAAWFYREKVSSFRLGLIAIGFLAVLLIIQPIGQNSNAWAWLCLLGTLLHTTRDLITRSIPKDLPSVFVTWSTAVFVTVLAGLVSIFQGWRPITTANAWPLIWPLAVAAVFLSFGYLMTVISMRTGTMSVVAPFRYSGLIFALAVGYVVWGEVPNALAWSGIVLLVLAGITMLRTSR